MFTCKNKKCTYGTKHTFVYYMSWKIPFLSHLQQHSGPSAIPNLIWPLQAPIGLWSRGPNSLPLLCNLDLISSCFRKQTCNKVKGTWYRMHTQYVRRPCFVVFTPKALTVHVRMNYDKPRLRSVGYSTLSDRVWPEERNLRSSGVHLSLVFNVGLLARSPQRGRRNVTRGITQRVSDVREGRWKNAIDDCETVCERRMFWNKWDVEMQ